MLIADIIRSKGSDVVTAAPTATVAELTRLLAEHRIGAVVVSGDGRHIEGIVSERDIVRALPQQGGEVLDAEVRSLMTTEVVTCTPKQTVVEMAELMTRHRFRHVPVVEDDELVAIVSIGDIVKARMALLEDERDQLIEYVQQ
ncbi:CBS domain-containing protein [Mobilicoccus massiliensis]|uniref:CBS domain-containing protein n=1 Tax=Mobilicoccus massiliensis TaxID=1522310 RepID=UPI00058DC8F5|nr:CBS domain-containing protein [Mobilicoccus massiliensis]